MQASGREGPAFSNRWDEENQEPENSNSNNNSNGNVNNGDVSRGRCGGCASSDMTEVMVRARRRHEQWPRDPQFLSGWHGFAFVTRACSRRSATSARKCRRRYRHPAGLPHPADLRPRPGQLRAPALRRRIDAIVERLGGAPTIEVINTSSDRLQEHGRSALHFRRADVHTRERTTETGPAGGAAQRSRSTNGGNEEGLRPTASSTA